MPKILYVQDADPASLAARQAVICDEWREHGVVGWELRTTQSRNALLQSLAADAAVGAESVALVDLRTETGDIEQLGFRLAETIRRHPQLARTCRPIIATEEMTVANALYANNVGAFAVIDTTWAYGQPGTVYTDLLERVLAERAGELRLHRRDAWLFPEEGADLEDENRDLAANFEAWFGFTGNDLHLALLWGMANAVELEFLKEFLAEIGVAGSERIAKRELEKLQKAMAPHVDAMDRPETGRSEVAHRFLAEAIPPQPDPIAELSWPMPQHVRNIWRDQRDIVRLAFLEPMGLALLERFFEALGVVKGGARAKREAIEAAVKVAADAETLAFSRAFSIVQRSVHALDDAWADHRDHGAGSGVTVAFRG